MPVDFIADALFLVDCVQPESNPDARTILFASNRGRVGALFGNKFHAKQLKAWRMSKTHAWTCAFHYIFRSPVPGVAGRFQREIAELSAPATLKVGVMIRTGDTAWDDDSFDLNKIAAYFSCAREIEKGHGKPAQKALWYLTSDHRGLRAAAYDKASFDAWHYHAGCLRACRPRLRFQRLIHHVHDRIWHACTEHACTPLLTQDDAMCFAMPNLILNMLPLLPSLVTRLSPSRV